jgi:hypothetical protein
MSQKNCGDTPTLESVLDVGQGISIGPGRFGKKNKRRALYKRRAWRIWKKRITVGQEKFDKNNKFDQKKISNLCGKKIILKGITMLKKKSD